MKLSQDKMYYDDEAIQFISEELGIPPKLIGPVLNSKWDYYEKIGLIHDEPPVEEEEPIIIDEEDIVDYVEKDLTLPRELIEIILHGEDQYLVAKGIVCEMS